MRITEKIVTDGEFWIPSDAQRKIPGKLTISDGGEIELEITNVFGDWVSAFNDTIDISRILGATEKGRVTLDNCFYLSKKLSLVPDSSTSKARIHVNKAILGVAYEANKIVTFNTFKFSVEGLEDWLCIRPITTNSDDSHTKISIKYSMPEGITLLLIDGMEIQLVFQVAGPNLVALTEAKIKHHAYIKLVSNKARPLSDFIAVATKLNSFFCFAIDKTVCIKDIIATSKNVLMEIGEKKTPVNMRIFYKSYIFSPKKPTTHPQEMLFVFPDIKEDVSDTISKWIKIHDITYPALNLYLHKASEYRYIEDKFLTLAQGMEVYHRKTYKGKLNITERLSALFDLFKNFYHKDDDIHVIIADIVGIRNYLTHYNNNYKDKANNAGAINFLTIIMEFIFQLHLLKKIGFTSEKIKYTVQNNRQIQQKLNTKNPSR